MISRRIFRFILALLMLGFSQALFGQAVNATLVGTVTDATGAAVTNVKITATEAATGAVHLSATNESGDFTFPNMPPGNRA
jgi:Carboxypeptidase regulatory-like domain